MSVVVSSFFQELNISRLVPDPQVAGRVSPLVGCSHTRLFALNRLFDIPGYIDMLDVMSFHICFRVLVCMFQSVSPTSKTSATTATMLYFVRHVYEVKLFYNPCLNAFPKTSRSKKFLMSHEVMRNHIRFVESLSKVWITLFPSSSL